MVGSFVELMWEDWRIAGEVSGAGPTTVIEFRLLYSLPLSFLAASGIANRLTAVEQKI